MAKIVYNALLGGFYVVRGPHQTPISGRFPNHAEAAEWLANRGKPRFKITIGERTHRYATLDAAKRAAHAVFAASGIVVGITEA